MKIGILIDRLNVGGVEKIAIQQVKALRDSGEDASLVVLRRKGVVQNAFPELMKEIPVIYLDDRLIPLFKFSCPFPLFHFFSLFHITYCFFIPFAVKKKEFDYFIVHGTYTAFSAIAIKWIRKIPFSVFIWDPISYIVERVYGQKLAGLTKKILLLTAKHLDKFIISNTDVILTGGPAHNGLFNNLNPDKKILEISPGVNPLKKIALKKEDYILMVTAWKSGKNPEYIFELIKRIPKLRVKMVGKWLDSEYKKEFERKIKKINLSKNIEVIGEVNEKRLAKYYQEAVLLLQTNDDRGFGMPALEAAGHGTTFVIPKGQGVCNLFSDEIDGFYTKEKDTKKIAEYLNLLIENKQLALKMGKHAWETVKTHYSWQKHTEKLKNIAQIKRE